MSLPTALFLTNPVFSIHKGSPKEKLISRYFNLVVSIAKKEIQRIGKSLIQSDAMSLEEYLDDLISDLSNILEYVERHIIDTNRVNLIFDKAASTLLDIFNSTFLKDYKTSFFDLFELLNFSNVTETQQYIRIDLKRTEDRKLIEDLIRNRNIKFIVENKNITEILEEIKKPFEMVKRFGAIPYSDGKLVVSYKDNEGNNYYIEIDDLELAIVHKNENDGIISENLTLEKYAQKIWLNEITSNEFWSWFSYAHNTLSSGEMSSVLIFKKIYDYFCSGDVSKALSKPTIILLDEPNLGLHPELERKLIYLLNKYTKELIENAFDNSIIKYDKLNRNLDILKCLKNTSVQYIITTHSSIMVSDSPRSNILYLTNREIIPSEETFSSNLYEIMAHNMFVSSSLGEFSIKYLDDLEKEIEEFNYSKDNVAYDMLKRKINMVGDTFIKQALLSKFESITSRMHRDSINELKETINKIMLIETDEEKLKIIKKASKSLEM